MRSLKPDRRRLTLWAVIVLDVLLVVPAAYFNLSAKQVVVQTVHLAVSSSAEATASVSIPKDKFPYISVPKISSSAPLREVGVTEDGNMDVPKNPQEAGIFSLGAKAGQTGTAVVAGHVTDYGKQAVFTDLEELEPGDFVYIMTDSATTYKYEVTSSEEYDIDNAPLQKIFGASQDATLNLITCGGDWDKELDTYKKRRVVYAKLVTPGL